LFWTIPIEKAAIKASPGAGAGRYSLQNLAVPDFRDFFNAISPSPATKPAHVSFDVRWTGDGDRQTIRDETFGFTGSYVSGNATIHFTATDDGTGITYSSDPAGQTTVGGGIGHERNGVFFS
jgi:hypothetical protein